jgi:hypothetical protein
LITRVLSEKSYTPKFGPAISDYALIDDCRSAALISRDCSFLP